MTDEILKRCPCCKGEAEEFTQHDDQTEPLVPGFSIQVYTGSTCFGVRCKRCGLGHTNPYVKREYAIEAWNLRPDDEQIERLKKERDEARTGNRYARLEALANRRAEAAQADATQMREMLKHVFGSPGAMVFLDGRNEHGSHVLPSFPTNLPPSYEESLGDFAEEIISAAEALGFAEGDLVWTEWHWVEPQIGEYGRVELAGYWEFKRINETISRTVRKEDSSAAE